MKPDWGIRGGFEVVLDRVIPHLEQQGHSVVVMPVSITELGPTVRGIEIDPTIETHAAELVRYLRFIEQFEQVDTHRADLVISSQPPSFATPGRRHLSIFYHHARLFYDLRDVAIEAGVLPPDVAEIGTPLVRAADQRHLDDVGWFLAGSPTVQQRLALFNGLEQNVGLFLAGRGADIERAPAQVDRDIVLCVSRHEFPKRTELAAGALAALTRRCVMVGAGGRLGWVKQVATASCRDAPSNSRETWCQPAPWIDPTTSPTQIGSIEFRSNIADSELVALYSSALCVLAPALDEDYGLTALEAMSHGAPVIVCDDGGGLCDLVTHEVNGLVVEPTCDALAAAVERLAADTDLRELLGSNGRRTAAEFSWDRALVQLDAGVEAVMSS